MNGLFGVLGALCVVVVYAAAVYGWVNNIIILISYDALPLTFEIVARCVGIVFAPLGVIMGYL